MYLVAIGVSEGHCEWIQEDVAPHLSQYPLKLVEREGEEKERTGRERERGGGERGEGERRGGRGRELVTI